MARVKTTIEHVEELEYNSERPHLTIPEYGRNVQKLIRYGKTIEDSEKRQKYMEQIVDLMLQMSPQSKNLDDFKDRLWQHVFRIGGYDLEVMPPSGVKPTPEDEQKKPETIGYTKTETRFRHYGHHVQTLIEKARAMEPGEIRDGFTEVIGNYMKMAYKTWNREHYVSDDTIIQDLEALSDGELILDSDTSLDTLSNANRRKSKKSSSSNSGGKKNHHKKGGKQRGGNNRRRRSNRKD
ncbi:MAG: DUF4290 domain-containing protein [Bacteroidota bacterium]